MKYLVLKKNYFKNNRHKVVYFHDWCINEDWNELNEKLLKKIENNKICKYHWDNRVKLKRDYKFLSKLTSKLLNEITADFNKYHNLKYSNEYWKIILLPWLKSIIVLFYDRWEMVNYIPKKNLTFCIYDYKNINFVPEKFIDLNSQYEDFNCWLVSKIVEYKQNIKFIKKEVKTVKKYKPESRKEKKFTKIYSFLFKFLSKIFNCFANFLILSFESTLGSTLNEINSTSLLSIFSYNKFISDIIAGQIAGHDV